MQPQRDRSGRFLPGHKGGPGRPKGTRNPAYLNIVEEVITPEDWRALIQRVKRSALQGELGALKFLAPYLLGRPPLAAPAEDADDNSTSRPLPTKPVKPLAQASPSLLRESPQPSERRNGAHDGPVANTTTRRLVLRKRA